MYSGWMKHSKPHGYGVMLGELWAHEGFWEHGVLKHGNMINISTGLKVVIPLVTIPEDDEDL